MRRASLLIVLSLVTTAAFAGEPLLEANPRFAGRRFEGRHMILNASGPLTAEDRTALAAKGVLVGRSLTGDRYLARVAEGRMVADERVRSVEPLVAEKKLSRTALREAGIGRTWAELNVFFHDDVTFEEARTALLASGAAIEPLLLDFAPSRRITAKVAPEAMTALAANDEVLAVTGPIRYRISSDNARSASLSHVDTVHKAPYGLTGAGVTVSLFELGPAQADHPEFGGRLAVQASVTGGNNTNKLHATHVAGTIGAAGHNPDAKGMAPNVKILQFCVRSGGNNTCQNDFLVDKDEKLTTLGSRIDNNSWGYVLGWESEDFWVWNDGDSLWGAYELEITSTLDAISIDRNVLFVHSAGNDGNEPFLGDWGQHRHVDPETLATIKDKIFCYTLNGTGTDCPIGNACHTCETTKHHTSTPYDTIGLTASGKNTVAVGAVQLLGTNLEIAAFSSRGPAKDGRVKPDVVARGFGVLSTVPTNGYGSNQGTSMAAPVVTGISALLVEQYRKTLGTDPSPVQLKALLIGGADDIGRPGPDFTFGFGLVNAQASADLIINNSGRGIRGVTVGNAQTVEVPLIVSATQPNLRVVLQWGDPSIPLSPDSFIADKALVNDLDVKLIGPDGTTHLPYILSATNFEAVATQGVNTVDNTEEIEVKNAPAGVYRAIVTGTRVPEGPQSAVLVTNARTAAPCVDLTEGKNNDASSPYGDLVTGQTIYAGICTAGDTDIFRWLMMPGSLSVTVNAGDVPLQVALTGGVTRSVTVPANTTQTITATLNGNAATHVLMTVTAAGTIGAEPFYTFTPQFTQPNGPRRRSAR